MTISIKNTETVDKIRRLARLKRKGLTEVVDEAVSHELQRLQSAAAKPHADVMARIRQIQKDYLAGRLATTGDADAITGC
jgi:hypothetical protein